MFNGFNIYIKAQTHVYGFRSDQKAPNKRKRNVLTIKIFSILSDFFIFYLKKEVKTIKI